MSAEDGLFAVFLEARLGEKRTQWMVFPPAAPGHGLEGPTDGRGRCIKRRLDHGGHRAKWDTKTAPAHSEIEKTVLDQLGQYASTGWTIMEPVVISLDEDDYQKAWAAGSADTPYKALRHVEAVTRKRGYRITGAV